MAYFKQYESTFHSMNGEKIRIEIMLKTVILGFTLPFNLGESGPEISYGSSGDKKFTPILASTLKLPFLVDDGLKEMFIEFCRTEYEEGDVYINIYPFTSPTPLWSGYVLMDLSGTQDVSFPYEVELTAVDGIGLLKDYPFVPDTTQEGPYAEADTFISEGWKDVVYWIGKVLDSTKMATTIDNKASRNYGFSTSVNWYNQKHFDDEIDPLKDTRWKALNWYKVVDEDATVLKYEAFTVYEVLESICKTWGMRCVYWNHTFTFVQIPRYQTNESGTLAIPVNIRTFHYTYAGVYYTTREGIGNSWYSRYSLQIENLISPGVGLQKLAGGKWDNYPRVKKVSIDFMTLGDYNFFTGFPLLPNPIVQSPTTEYFGTTSLGIFTDSDQGGGWYAQISLSFTNLDVVQHQFQMNWGIRARPTTNTTTWDYMLIDTAGVLSWTAYAAPGFSPIIPDSVLPFNHLIALTPGTQTINITSLITGAGVIPTNAAFAGDWEFEVYTYTVGDSVALIGNVVIGHGAVDPAPFIVASAYVGASPTGIITYSNISGANNFFSTLTSGAIGPSFSTNTFQTAATDTYSIDMGKILFGDSLDTASPSAIQVYTGSAWVFTDFTGEWGIGTGAGGSSSMVELLGSEIINCQAIDSAKLICGIALAKKGKRDFDATGSRDKYINPVSRLTDTDGRKYVMLNATFNMLRDEWSGTWFEFTIEAPIFTTSVLPMVGPTTGIVLSSAAVTGRTGARLGLSTPIPRLGFSFTQTTAQYDQSASPITSIAIVDIGATLLKTDDVLEIYDFKGGHRYEITLSADQTDGDETLSIDSLAYSHNISAGSLIQMSQEDATQQYQRKSRGTIGGMPVTATTLGPIRYSIETGYTIDSEIIIGVDTEYIKILPSDFVANTGGGSTKTLHFNDSGTTGVKPANNSTILWAFIALPYGKKSSALTIWGNGTKPVDVYNMELDASGTGVSLGTGTVGTELAFTEVESTGTNMLAIEVSTDSTANRIYGGKITIEDI